MNAVYDVVILGAGYAGLMGALCLRRMKETFRIALINASDQFLERVRLQESIVTVVTSRFRRRRLQRAGLPSRTCIPE